MKFEQIRKLIDVVTDEHYTHPFDEKPIVDIILHESSIRDLQTDIQKNYPDAVSYVSKKEISTLELQINIQGFIVNLKPFASKLEVKIPTINKVVADGKLVKKEPKK